MTNRQSAAMSRYSETKDSHSVVWLRCIFGRSALVGSSCFWHHRPVFRAALISCFALLALSGCRTVALGDNFIPPDLMLDEDFFFCRIQPEVISPQGCASGGSGEAGQCHSSRSALRLSSMAEADPAPSCDGDVLVGSPPLSYEANLNAIRTAVQSDPLSSPLYRRPLALDSHPRQIFDSSSPEADLISQWILMGGS